MISLAEYIFFDHFRLATDGAILLAVGLFTAIPVVKYRLTMLQWPAIRIMNLVDRLIGAPPRIARTAIVIWLFNSSVMFFYMASGFHPLMPKLFGILTGLNIGIVLGRNSRKSPGDMNVFASPLPKGYWQPPRKISALCGLLVLAIELPCLFYSLALGMRLGAEVAWGDVTYTAALPERALAFGAIILPALLLSAVAEAVAIRGGLQKIQ